ncbi:MAG: type II secretion system protein [Planctomycetes bacterium]|nr:type II secretion system protein [Planctomycetota bacterium]
MMQQRGPRESQRGFTLLELMVAMALSAVLIGMVVTVSTRAQQLYDETSARVEVLQKARYVLNDLRDHLQLALPTSDLEFYVDRSGGRDPQNGHWDEGEELKDDASGPNLVGGRPGYYDEGTLVIEKWYTTERLGVESRHANFSLYFKGPTTVRGDQRVANIEYYLADPVAFAAGETGKIEGSVESNANLVLVKVVRYIDTDASSFYNQELKVREDRYELCPNVTDLKIEYFFDNVGDREPGAFVTPGEEAGSRRAKSEQRVKPYDGGYVKEFIYGGFREMQTRGVAKKGRRTTRTGELVAPYFEVGDEKMYFSELNFGDQLYIWTDGGTSKFPSGDYTVYRREVDRLYFKERVDDSAWEGDQGALRFKAGYLPSAFRITVRVLNDSGREARNLSIVVQTLNKRA